MECYYVYQDLTDCFEHMILNAFHPPNITIDTNDFQVWILLGSQGMDLSSWHLSTSHIKRKEGYEEL